jgi:hypothetical protein
MCDPGQLKRSVLLVVLLTGLAREARASDGGVADAACPSACINTGTECLASGNTRGSPCAESSDCCCSTSDSTCSMFACVAKADAGSDAGRACCPPVPSCASPPVSDGMGCLYCMATVGAACHTSGACGESEFCYGLVNDGGTGQCCGLNHDCFYGEMVGADGCPECSPPTQDAGATQDAAATHDAGGRDADTPHDDAGAIAPGSSGSGCSCKTATAPSSGAPLGLVALGVWLSHAARRRRRRTR